MNPDTSRFLWTPPRPNGARLVSLALGLLAAVGCDAARASNDTTRVATMPARRYTGTAAVLWSTRAADVAGAWRNPNRIAARGNKVYVLDPGLRSLTALNARTGKLLWTVRTGDGRTPFVQPRDIAIAPRGDLAVADMGAHAVFLLDSMGRVQNRLAVLPPVYSICALDSGFLVLTWATQHPFWLLTRQGEVRAKYDVPWPSLVGAPMNETNGALQGDESGRRCVYTLEAGNGFAEWQAIDGFGPPRTYVEQLSRSDLAKGKMAGQSGLPRGDSIYIAFAGTGRESWRTVDVYTDNGGRYVRSFVLPRIAYWMTDAGGRFITLVPDGETRLVMAVQE